MKNVKLLISAYFLLFSGIGYCQLPDPSEIIYLNQHHLQCLRQDAEYYEVTTYDDVLGVYVIKEYFLSGELHKEGYYASLRPRVAQGVKTYDKTGNLLSAVAFHDGKQKPDVCILPEIGDTVDCNMPQVNKNGLWEEHIHDGYPAKSTGSYSMGKKEGKWTLEGWGKLTEINFKNGQKEGEEIVYGLYMEKHVEYSRNWKAGKLEGVSLKMRTTGSENELGTKEAEIHYANGLPIDTAYWWFPNGQPEMQQIYLPSRKLIKVTEWYEDGTKKTEGMYTYPTAVNTSSQWEQFDQDGEKSGTWTSWHKTGTIRFKGAYIDDKPDGEFTWYHTNGQKAYKCTYKNGLANGQAIQYHPSGKKSASGTFSDGIKNGDWTYWDMNGKPIDPGICFSSDFKAEVNLRSDAYYLLKVRLKGFAKAILDHRWEDLIAYSWREHFNDQFVRDQSSQYGNDSNDYSTDKNWPKFRDRYIRRLLGVSYVDNYIDGDLSMISRIVYDRIDAEPQGMKVHFTVYLCEGSARSGWMWIHPTEFAFFSSFG